MIIWSDGDGGEKKFERAVSHYMISLNQKSLAGIEYIGKKGSSRCCKKSIVRLLHFGDEITFARLLTYVSGYDAVHCFILTIGDYDLIAVKSGFSSGYSGEGPRTLSEVLQLLQRHGIEIDEYLVSLSIIEKIDKSCLSIKDIEQIENTAPIRPLHWHDYVLGKDHYYSNGHPSLRNEFPVVIPYAIIDHRLIDIALEFQKQPDSTILSGFRRLEDLIRSRTKLTENGVKLFSKAFQGEDSILAWKDIDPGEQQGRAQLFTGVYMAFRNRRAHREASYNAYECLLEFLQINHLFILESEAKERVVLEKV